MVQAKNRSVREAIRNSETKASAVSTLNTASSTAGAREHDAGSVRIGHDPLSARSGTGRCADHQTH